MATVTVHIIESPSPDDFLDDRREGHALRSALAHAQIPAELYTVVDEERFFSAIGKIIGYHHNRDQKNDIPIVHLSMHGNDACVALTNGKEFQWDVLGAAIGLANSTLGETLLVAMSTCHGFKAIEMARVEGKPPFLALVGPTDVVAWRDTVAAFVAFYHYLVRSEGKITDATNVMNSVLARQNPLFNMASGYEVQASFKAQIKNPKTLRERIVAAEEAKCMELATSKAEAVRRGWQSVIDQIRRAGEDSPTD